MNKQITPAVGSSQEIGELKVHISEEWHESNKRARACGALNDGGTVHTSHPSTAVATVTAFAIEIRPPSACNGVEQEF